MNRIVGKVKMYGALDPDGTVMRRCRIDMNGTPVNAILYEYDGSRYVRIDRITGGVMTDLPDGSIELRGVSDELVGEVGVKPEDAVARWVVTPVGCATCR